MLGIYIYIYIYMYLLWKKIKICIKKIFFLDTQKTNTFLVLGNNKKIFFIVENDSKYYFMFIIVFDTQKTILCKRKNKGIK